MIILKYSGAGKAYSDFEVENVAKEIFSQYPYDSFKCPYLTQFQQNTEQNGYDFIYEFSTENLLDAIRVYIVENRIDLVKTPVALVFENEKSFLSRFGNPKDWPEGINETMVFGRTLRIVKGQMAIRKEERGDKENG